MWFMTTSLVFALHLCHYGVGTDVASVKAEKLLWHLGDVSPQKKNKSCKRKAKEVAFIFCVCLFVARVTPRVEFIFKAETQIMRPVCEAGYWIEYSMRESTAI